MKAKAIAGVLALGVVALLGAPTAASAKPPTFKIPRFESAQVTLHGTHGYLVFIAIVNGHAEVTAAKFGRDGGASLVNYSRPVAMGHDGRLRFGLGRAGEVDVRFEPGKVEEEGSSECEGGPSVIENGRFVGKISFHPRGGPTSVEVDQTHGVLARRPPQVCPGRVPKAHRARHGNKLDESIRSLIAGSTDGSRRFTATTVPPFPGEESATTSFDASVTREEGALTILDVTDARSVPVSTFAVPDLLALPATATFEPPAPFSGSATIELPSRRTATLTGDLAVELPELGRVPLTGPEIDAGVCRGFACTKSLPKALRPSRSASLSIEIVEKPEKVPTK